MSIQFRCKQCGRLLKTDDSTVGRQAACPECGALTTVPCSVESSGGSPLLAPLTSELPTTLAQASDNPFGVSAPVCDTSEGENPYQSPGEFKRFVPHGEADPLAVERIAAPANALLAVGIINIILHAGILLLYSVVLVETLGANARNGQDLASLVLGCGMFIAASLVGLLMDVVLLIGARKMKRLDGYLFAVIASIIAMIPCISPCCFLGIPFGIWALLTLNDSSIKLAFRN